MKEAYGFYHVTLTLVTLFFLEKKNSKQGQIRLLPPVCPGRRTESIHSQQAFSRHKSKAVGSHSLISCPLRSQIRLFQLRFLL